jgi:hypothetical protein
MLEDLISSLLKSIAKILICEVHDLSVVDILNNGFEGIRPQFELHLTDSIEIYVDPSFEFHIEEVLLSQNRSLCQSFLQLLL